MALAINCWGCLAAGRSGTRGVPSYALAAQRHDRLSGPHGRCWAGRSWAVADFARGGELAKWKKLPRAKPATAWPETLDAASAVPCTDDRGDRHTAVSDVAREALCVPAFLKHQECLLWSLCSLVPPRRDQSAGLPATGHASRVRRRHSSPTRIRARSRARPFDAQRTSADEARPPQPGCARGKPGVRANRGFVQHNSSTASLRRAPFWKAATGTARLGASKGPGRWLRSGSA